MIYSICYLQASKRLFDMLRLLKLMDLPAEAKNSLKVLSNEWKNGTEYLTETTRVSAVECPAKVEDLSLICGIPFPPPDTTQTVSMDYSNIEENIVEKKDVSEMRFHVSFNSEIEENIVEKKDVSEMR
ncbi:uncharacterized protein LOC109831324 [Asparagus officinalis]|uniref:uncharacterized protein LOC109831324 n=1 Tax=Asparagus officinalis TaxID=4686 RepID=UPI00098E0BC5|nr:uncharacterized protein LOC109831324 [Asparagus officinalis]